MRFISVLYFSLCVTACGGGSGIPTNRPDPAPDNTPPVISLLGSSSITIELGSTYEEPGATATDNIDGAVEVEIAGSVADQLGTYTLTYTATDSAANTSSVNRTVTVVEPTDTIKAINTAKWFHQTVIPNGWSWFNNEQQLYTNRTANSFVSGGTLKIVAKKEQFTDQGVTKQYTSARLNSKFAFTYGRVEVRAKMPTGHGTWPAIWMLGKNISERGAYWETQGFGTTSWPACGELDILEHWGRNQNYVQSAIHTPSSHGATINHGGQYIASASTDFHIYSMDWNPQRMVFSVDGMEHYSYDPVVKDANTWPFDEDLYLLLNVAIESGIDANFTESAMEVDYVRIYNSAGQLIWSDEFN